MTEIVSGFDPSLIDINTERPKTETPIEAQPQKQTLLERYEHDLGKLKNALLIVLDGIDYQIKTNGDTTLLRQKEAKLREQIRKDSLIIQKLSRKK